jgi:hypothetical protein
MKLSKRRRRLWNFYVKTLKEQLPPGVPVTVQTRPMKICGDSVGIMKLGRMVGIVIRINSNRCWRCKTDTLMHEWAHAMEWSAHWVDGSPKEDHGETWGVWYSKCYRLLVEDSWGEIKRRGLLHHTQTEKRGIL